ncbi:MAG: hypothetical protein MJ136_08030, partial [Clostridia bacterium]|nr:hypothetical protein [Clostridia bacterium]
SPAAVTAEQLEAADALRRQAEQELQETGKKLVIVNEKINSIREKLSQLKITEDVTEKSVQQKAQEAEKLAKQYLENIESREKALKDVEGQLNRSAGTMDSLQQGIGGLESDLKEQRGKFEAGLSELGFSSAREFELARMSDADMNRIEKAVREYGEQLRSQKDHAERLREQLAGKQPEDLGALQKLYKELSAACNKA